MYLLQPSSQVYKTVVVLATLLSEFARILVVILFLRVKVRTSDVKGWEISVLLQLHTVSNQHCTLINGR